MSTHPYLRAYMAGIALPTMFMLLVGAVFIIARYAYHLPVPIERGIVFPLTVIPNVFGLWNMLYIKLQPAPRWPIGLHGAVLPFVLAPLGFAFGHVMGFVRLAPDGLVYFEMVTIPYAALLVVLPLPLMVYYLLWKYVIAFFNRVLALA